MIDTAGNLLFDLLGAAAFGFLVYGAILTAFYALLSHPLHLVAIRGALRAISWTLREGAIRVEQLAYRAF